MTNHDPLCYRFPMRLAVLLAALLCSPLIGQRWGTRLDGAPLTALAPPQAAAVVLFFVATDCPISNRTFPEMRRLREEFSRRGVRFWVVYPNTYEKPEDIQSHQRAYDPGSDAIQDLGGALVRLVHAAATPQMAVLVPNGGGWLNKYSGALDNRFVHIGLERPFATEHFGEDAIASVLEGRPVHRTRTTPVGCAIMNPGVQ